MAARKRTWTPEVVRQRIRVSMLMKRLEDHATGKLEMSPQQAKSLHFAIDRVIPRAEAPKDINLHLSLEELIAASMRPK
jgi:hypothetical protein